MKNLFVIRLVENLMISQESRLADPNFRKSLSKEAKIRLVRLMYNMAIEAGGRPTKPFNL